MHDVSNASDHAEMLRHHLAQEVADVEPRHLLPEILAAARRCDPWLTALIAGLALATLIAAIAWAASRPAQPPATPTPRPQPAPTAPQET